jgi:hypothetical protein
MARCSSKPPTLRLATQHEIYRFIARQSIGSIQEVQGIETPVDTIEAEVLGKVVFELVFALETCQWSGREVSGRRTVSRLWMYFTCGSMASWSSSGRAEEPATPGPDTKDIFGDCVGGGVLVVKGQTLWNLDAFRWSASEFFASQSHSFQP